MDKEEKSEIKRKIDSLFLKRKQAEGERTKALLTWTEATKGQFLAGHESGAADLADNERRIWEACIREIDEEIVNLRIKSRRDSAV